LLRDLIGTINPRAVYVAGMPLELGVRAIALELGLIVPAVFIVEDACWYNALPRVLQNTGVIYVVV
jgi:hypothetical protein